MAVELKKVLLNADVFMVCCSHAFSTEREEIMGLLIGETVTPPQVVAKISHLLILNRVDKRKDRCEISSEQLAAASTHAEQLAREHNRPLRVIGWYHSHPHITVWPSHVDLQTQGMWQSMDPTFIGLIFSCFNSDSEHQGRIELTSFQTGQSGQRVEIPTEVVWSSSYKLPTLDALKRLTFSFLQEEKELFKQAQSACEDELLVSIHNNAVYTAALCRLLDRVCLPVTNTLQARLTRNKIVAKELKEEIAKLKQTAAAMMAPI
eukprot:m.143758 g.143758  ORF g.143758 m.143758 type:complete len:263 (+) comp30333_c0_seq2:243-1031(+)